MIKVEQCCCLNGNGRQPPQLICPLTRSRYRVPDSICLGTDTEEVGSVVRSRGCSACCARRVYWNVNYFGVIRAIAMARAVVGHRERAVPVACWPSRIYGCSYVLSIGLTTSLKTIDCDCW